jgi:phage gpG-like protein
MTLYSLESFAALLTKIAVTEEAEQRGLEKAAVIVETEAKRVIGTYDYGWAPLAPSTLAHKAADTPLLETGEMRDSIQHQVEHRAANIGSNNDKAVWQELGTAKIPARSFLGGAAMHKGKEVADAIGTEMFTHLTHG